MDVHQSLMIFVSAVPGTRSCPDTSVGGIITTQREKTAREILIQNGVCSVTESLVLITVRLSVRRQIATFRIFIAGALQKVIGYSFP